MESKNYKLNIKSTKAISSGKIVLIVVSFLCVIGLVKNNVTKEKNIQDSDSLSPIETAQEDIDKLQNLYENQENVPQDADVSEIILETNGKYTGERVDLKKQGIGKYEWNDGSVYEGEFSDDKINGQGKLTIPQKGTYEGTFVNGKKNGQGIYTFANGDIYNGNWVDDEMSGKGTYTFSNGDKYEGDFLNNKFNGQGTYTIGSNKYTGTWSNNKYIEK